MKSIDWTGKLPSCQNCNKPESGRFDVKTVFGPWGDFCGDCVDKVSTPELKVIGYERVPEGE